MPASFRFARSFGASFALVGQLVLGAALTLGAVACHPTTHDVTPAKLGRATDLREMEAHLDEPGPITFTKVTAANWKIDLSGLLNLDHPKAEAAGIEDRKEPIQIYFYVLEHPTRGMYIVDTGVARSVAERSDDMPVGSIVRSFMNLDAMKVHGGYGYSTEFEVERLYRDAILMSIGEGTNDVLRTVVARSLVRGDVKLG